MVIDDMQAIWSGFMRGIPEQYSFLVYLAVYAVVITIYATFVWKLHKFMGRRDVVELNLWKYIKTEENAARKLIASFFYIVEFIILMPFLVFFWYAIFSLFFLVLAKEQPISNILLIGMAIVASIRISSYFNQNLSKELAKLLPFTLLAVFLTTPQFFSVENLISRLAEMPDFFDNMLYYIIFVGALETVLRIFTVIKELFMPPEEAGKEKE